MMRNMGGITQIIPMSRVASRRRIPGSLMMSAAQLGLTPQDVAETLIEILERDPSLLDRGTLNEPGSALHDGRAGRECVRLKFERLRDVPRTMDRQPELSPDPHRIRTGRRLAFHATRHGAHNASALLLSPDSGSDRRIQASGR